MFRGNGRLIGWVSVSLHMGLRVCVLSHAHACICVLELHTVRIHASVRVFAFMWKEEAIYFDCFQCGSSA